MTAIAKGTAADRSCTQMFDSQHCHCGKLPSWAHLPDEHPQSAQEGQQEQAGYLSPIQPQFESHPGWALLL